MIAFLSLISCFGVSTKCFSPEWDWSFPDAGQLPVPVLSIENISFAYPGGKELYSKVDFGVDLQTRVALVGRKLLSCPRELFFHCSIVLCIHPLLVYSFTFSQWSWKNNTS